METVYTFPNGFRTEAEWMYGWLRVYNLNPKWKTVGGDLLIQLPAAEVPCLRLMQRHDPARFGNHPEVSAALVN